MPLLKIRPYLINSGSFTGSFSGTGSYARRALTASYVLGGAAGSSGTSGANGSSGTSGNSGTSGTSATAGRSSANNPLAWFYIAGSNKSTTRLQVEAINTSNTYIDPEDYNVTIFSN